MVRSRNDRRSGPAWSRREQISYWISVGALLFAIGTLDWAIETDRRPLALAILGLGVVVVFALIGYTVRRVLRER